jgi:hypothetical protein
MILTHSYRKDLIDVLQNGAMDKQGYEFPDELALLRNLRADSELQLIWTDKRYRLPAAIIVNSSKKDFLAWAATYLNNFRPFTSFFRVLDITFCSSIAQSMRDSFKMDQKCEDIFIGLIIGETLTYLEEGHPLDNVNLSTYSRTFSYVMAKAFYSGLVDHFGVLSDSWLKLRHLTAQSNLAARSDVAKIPWTFFMKLFSRQNPQNLYLFDNDDNSHSLIFSAAQEFMLNGKLSENSLIDLFQGHIQFKSNVLASEGTREERVLSFQKILPLILDSTQNEQIKSFTAAYLVDRLAPGTFEHFNILRSLTRYLPSSLVWYGFFSGLNKKSYLKNISFGLGNRLLRDILQKGSIFERTAADISYDEFNMLLSNIKNASIRTKIRGQLEIEILPNISTSITWPLDSVESIQRQAPTHEIQKLKNEFENSISKVKDSYQKVLDLLTPSNSTKYSSGNFRKERAKKQK